MTKCNVITPHDVTRKLTEIIPFWLEFLNLLINLQFNERKMHYKYTHMLYVMFVLGQQLLEW